jgi:excisionase family DNA binding protein
VRVRSKTASTAKKLAAANNRRQPGDPHFFVQIAVVHAIHTRSASFLAVLARGGHSRLPVEISSKFKRWNQLSVHTALARNAGTDRALRTGMHVTDGSREAIAEPRIGRSVSLDHAAELLGVSRRTIYNWIRDGRLQTIRTLGGSQRVLLDSVQVVRSQTADGAARSSY